jgi:hypothetical protein
MFALAADVAQYLVEVPSGEVVQPTATSGRKMDEQKN